MSPAERPAPVVRFLRRPLWWIGGVACFVLLFLALDLIVVREQDTRFARSFVVEGRSDAPWDGSDRLIDVRYLDPRTGTEHRASVFGDHPADPPALGAPITLEVAEDDPQAVRLAEHPRGALDDLTFYAAGVVLAAVFGFARRSHIRRLDALMASDGTSYAMLGAILPPDVFHLRWRLFLYPVDAAAGAAPVCAVALLHVPSVPTGVCPVEVKGGPRPFGLVAVRAGDDVLWPRGRALPRATFPRPSTVGHLVPVLPDERPRPPDRAPSPWPPRLVLLFTLVCLALAQVTDVVATLEVKRILERSRLVVATVEAIAPSAPPDRSLLADTFSRGPRRDPMTVRYGSAAGQQTAVVRLATNVRPGDVVQVRHDPVQPQRAWATDEDIPPGSGSASTWFFALIAVVPAALVGRAGLQSSTATRTGARELLIDGRISTGTPPMSALGLTLWEGRLEVREIDWSAFASASLTRTSLRLGREALTVVDGDGTRAAIPWDDERLVDDPDPTRLSERARAVAVVALVQFVAATPAARASLSDPGRLVVLGAALACRPWGFAANEPQWPFEVLIAEDGSEG